MCAGVSSPLVQRLAQPSAEVGRWLEVDRTEPAEVRIVRHATSAARLPDYDDRGAPLPMLQT